MSDLFRQLNRIAYGDEVANMLVESDGTSDGCCDECDRHDCVCPDPDREHIDFDNKWGRG